MHIAFYAPLKPPNHLIPCGARQIARLLIAALELAGHKVDVVSTLRAYRGQFDEVEVGAFKSAAEDELARLLLAYRRAAERPDVWLSYHVYYKSPDLIGPRAASALGIPYVTVEASYAPRRDREPWRVLQLSVVDAVRQAAINFCLTPADREGLTQIADPATLLDLPPFVDVERSIAPDRMPGHGVGQSEGHAGNNAHYHGQTGKWFTEAHLASPPTLVTVAMMRSSKLPGFQMLAKALAQLLAQSWRLVVIGDGSEREAVRAAFALFPDNRVDWVGELQPEYVMKYLRAANLYIWPGHGDAFGLAYLEAQSAGVPVVAQAIRGIPAVVRDGDTGFLVPEGDVEGFAGAIRRLLGDPQLRARMSRAAREFVHGERTVAQAMAILDVGLGRALDRPPGWVL
jgi:glycosyltransferase involved in cell wall biosynthesis